MTLSLGLAGRSLPFSLEYYLIITDLEIGQWKITNGLATMCTDVRKPEAEVGDF